MSALAVVTSLVPDRTIDPWDIISLKKISTLISAIIFIQLAGIEIIKVLGSSSGSIVTGFLAGLISSTATVASLAKTSKVYNANMSSHFIMFMSSTIAMQVVAATIVILGTKGIHYPLLIIILFPVISALAMIYLEIRHTHNERQVLEPMKFEILHVLKLTAFIVLTIFISKFFQRQLSESAKLLLTFLVSLFEMHGSIIANLQLHDAGVLSLKQLGSLIATSVLASYTSKLFLIFAFAKSDLKRKVLMYSLVSFVTLGIGWALFMIKISFSH